MGRLGALLFLLISITGCQTSSSSLVRTSPPHIVEGYNIAEAWDNAMVYSPSNRYLPITVREFELAETKPVIVFLHGCGGVGDTERRYAAHFARLGFIVVFPNSLSISGRVTNCDGRRFITNLGIVPVHELRPAEAEFALNQVRLQPWADKEKIFLMGHSEGAMGVSRARVEGIRGIVISGFRCSFGVRADKSIPLLVINWEQDPFFPDRPHCSQRRFWTDRSNVKELLLPGRGHGTASSSAFEAVENFVQN